MRMIDVGARLIWRKEGRESPDCPGSGYGEPFLGGCWSRAGAAQK